MSKRVTDFEKIPCIPLTGNTREIQFIRLKSQDRKASRLQALPTLPYAGSPQPHFSRRKGRRRVLRRGKDGAQKECPWKPEQTQNP